MTKFEQFQTKALAFTLAGEAHNEPISYRQIRTIRYMVANVDLREDFAARIESKMTADGATMLDGDRIVKWLAVQPLALSEPTKVAEKAVKAVAQMSRPTLAEIGMMTLNGEFGPVAQRKSRALATA